LPPQEGACPRSPLRASQLTVPETPTPELQAQQAAAKELSRRAVAGVLLGPGPGRHVDGSPSKGRMSKSRRVDGQLAAGAWAAQPCAPALLLLAPLRHCSPASLPRRLPRLPCRVCPAAPAVLVAPHNPNPPPAAARAAGSALLDGRGTYDDVVRYAERLFCRIRQAVACQQCPTTLKAAFLDPVAERLALEVQLELFARPDGEFMAMFTGGRRAWLVLALAGWAWPAWLVGWPACLPGMAGSGAAVRGAVWGAACPLSSMCRAPC
jgi:hypothetical protein